MKVRFLRVNVYQTCISVYIHTYETHSIGGMLLDPCIQLSLTIDMLPLLAMSWKIAFERYNPMFDV